MSGWEQERAKRIEAAHRGHSFDSEAIDDLSAAADALPQAELALHMAADREENAGSRNFIGQIRTYLGNLQ